jgi:hypothetical protein
METLKKEGAHYRQGCKIFLGTTYQNGINIPKRQQNVANDYKIY